MYLTTREAIALPARLSIEDIADLPAHSTLDFDAVGSVGFATLRALLARQKAGDDFDVINASTDVYLMFDSTGANRFVHVARKPRELDLSSFHIAGDGNMGDCYFDDQGDCMVKLYSDPKLLAMARLEKIGAYAAFVSGIPTPLVGEEITSSGRRGVIFERARNKKSIARLIADDPDNIERYVEIFADMAKRLHATPCAKGLAPAAAEIRRRRILDADFISEDKRERALAFVDAVPPADTCVHGDLHIGNLVVGDAGPQFIDMGGFSYGNPNFDLGWTYLISSLLHELGGGASATALAGFHLSAETTREVWRLFEKHYYGAETPEQIQEVEDELMPFAIIKLFGMVNMLGRDNPSLREKIVQDIDALLFSRI